MKNKKKNNLEVVITRHCATELNDKNLLQGSWLDFPLSENGREQAKLLGEAVREAINYEKFDFVIVSNTQRTDQTARFIAPENDIKMDSRVLVFDIGTADAVHESEAKTFKGFPIPGIYKKMENPFKYYKRIKSFFSDLMFCPEFNNKRVLVVTHKDVTALAEHFLEDEKLIKSLKMGQDNGEFKIYKITGDNESER